MWAAPEEGGFLAANLEEMNWHTFSADPRIPQQTLTVNQRKDKGGRFFFFFFTRANTASAAALRFRLEGYFIPQIVANIIVGGGVIVL